MFNFLLAEECKSSPRKAALPAGEGQTVFVPPSRGNVHERIANVQFSNCANPAKLLVPLFLWFWVANATLAFAENGVVSLHGSFFGTVE